MKGQFSAASPARTVDRRKKQRRRINMWCWIFMIPTLILYILFQGYPILSSIFYSTLDWSGMTSSALFVGLDNFKELLQDKYFFNAVANSFKYMLMAVPLQLVISLALAYIFNSILKKGATFFRTVFFLPVITTASIVGIIMMFIFGGTLHQPVSVSLWSEGIKLAGQCQHGADRGSAHRCLEGFRYLYDLLAGGAAERIPGRI